MYDACLLILAPLLAMGILKDEALYGALVIFAANLKMYVFDTSAYAAKVRTGIERIMGGAHRAQILGLD
jgi:hypothetical protein